MTVFQWITLSFLGLLILLELVGKVRGRRGGLVWLVRLALWTAAAIGIYRPEWVSLVAAMLGIQRGADLVTYTVALTFLATTFYFYARYTELQRQLTQVVRHIAIQEAKRGQPSSTPPADETEMAS